MGEEGRREQTKLKARNRVKDIFTTYNKEIVSRIYKETVQSNIEKANKSKEKMKTEYDE